MTSKILVVDPNEAFAAVLEEMLEADGGYRVEVAHTGSDALALLGLTHFDLTIVDMDLETADMGYRDMILKVRQLEPTMRLMMIPLMGRDLPPEAQELDIQGTLSKPFFADDLLPHIEDALARQVSPTTSQAATPPASEPVQQAASNVQSILSELAREISADAVLLLSTATGRERIVAHASKLDGARLETLADLGLATVRAAQAAARFLGQPDRPFEHNMFESDPLRLYMMAAPDDTLLMAVTPLSTPLGTIRHNLRRTARSLREPART